MQESLSPRATHREGQLAFKSPLFLPSPPPPQYFCKGDQASPEFLSSPPSARPETTLTPPYRSVCTAVSPQTQKKKFSTATRSAWTKFLGTPFLQLLLTHYLAADRGCCIAGVRFRYGITLRCGSSRENQWLALKIRLFLLWGPVSSLAASRSLRIVYCKYVCETHIWRCAAFVSQISSLFFACKRLELIMASSWLCKATKQGHTVIRPVALRSAPLLVRR
jgi:hypothetical protein